MYQSTKAMTTMQQHPITRQVLDSFQAAAPGNNNNDDEQQQETAASTTSSPPRTQEILQKLVRHLHAFVQDVQPTPEEWMTAIDFLTRTGQKCDDTRQEYILLSDVLGVSMLVDSIEQTKRSRISAPEKFPHATQSTVQGPFHVPSDPAVMGDQLAKGPEQTRGELTRVSGVVRDAVTGEPIANASIDVWQSDDLGQYDIQQQQQQQQQESQSQPALQGSSLLKKNLRATFTTGPDGRYWFQTIRPASYPVPTDGPVGELLRAMGRHPMRPAHIHFLVQAPPRYHRLVTHLFVQGDPYLDSDAVFGVKESLIVEFVLRKSNISNSRTGAEDDNVHDNDDDNDDDDDSEEEKVYYQVEFDVGLVPIETNENA